MEILALPFLLLVGGLLALQAAANVQLAGAMTSPFGASTLQLGIGAALLLALAAAAGSLGAFSLLDDAPPWELLGGLGSAVYITAGILLFPRVGALVAVALFIAGQMLASLLLDGFGWLGVEPEPLTVVAGLGGAAVVAGGWLIAGARTALPARGAWLSLGLLAGAVLPVQGAVNAQLRADVDEPVAAALVSFLVATAAMALVLGLALSLRSTARPRVAPLRGMPWWGWLRRRGRRHLRHVGLPAHPGDRGGADDRAHGRRPAGRVGARRPPRPAPPPAPPDHRPAARRRRGPADRRRARAARLGGEPHLSPTACSAPADAGEHPGPAARAVRP